LIWLLGLLAGHEPWKALPGSAVVLAGLPVYSIFQSKISKACNHVMPDKVQPGNAPRGAAKPKSKPATKLGRTKPGRTKLGKTKIAIIEDAQATGDVAAAYDAWRASSGRTHVPGIVKCFSARPDFLRQVLDFSNTVHFSEGHLSRRHKEMIASHVSYLNRCPY
jgi:hypothetical protein